MTKHKDPAGRIEAKAALSAQPDAESVALAGELEVIEKMIETRDRGLASCIRMIELLQPEWDKFEARTGHDIYVARDYADHTSAARTHRKELAALKAILTALRARMSE